MFPAVELSVWAGCYAGGTWAVSGVSGKSLTQGYLWQTQGPPAVLAMFLHFLCSWRMCLMLWQQTSWLCTASLNNCSCLVYHWDWRCLQASALVTNQKCSLHIPYCCLTECIRGPDGEWMYGLHMDQEFLSSKQEKSDADKQREMWGLDEANPWMWPQHVWSVLQCKTARSTLGGSFHSL